ncbi:MAG: hypothetical protein AAGH15_20705, partial [Myxococcota bacterium]
QDVRRFLVEQLPPLRRVLRDRPTDVGLLARAAAALLVANPDDGHGRAMLARALEEGSEPGPVGLRAKGETPRERFEATCALALAAARAARPEDAEALLAAAAFQAPDLVRAGGAPTFWWLATGAYGLFGAATEAELRAGDAREQASFGSGVAVLAGGARAGSRFGASAAPAEGHLFVRAEVIYGRPFEASEGPIALTLRSELGELWSDGPEPLPLGESIAFELAVQAERAVSRPIVEIALPTGVVVTDATLAAMNQASAVRRATRRRPGFLRLELEPLAAEALTTLPLPLTFFARGELAGLGMSAYDVDAPGERTTTGPRALSIE